MEAVIAHSIVVGMLYVFAAIIAMIGGAIDREFYYGNPFPPFLAFWYDLTYNAEGWADRNQDRQDAREGKK